VQNELVRWAQRRIDSDVVVSASDFANACGDDDILADVVDSLKVRCGPKTVRLALMARACQPWPDRIDPAVDGPAPCGSALQSIGQTQSLASQPRACVAASTTVSARERA
jgi:hypothetical protein